MAQDPSSAEHKSATGNIKSSERFKVLRPLENCNLNRFSTWLQGVGTRDIQRVYSVKDGVLRISGEGMGYLATVDQYQDYHLSVEYRWGEKTDGTGGVRNSGILLHASGPDGNAKGIWMASIECQLAQGCEGDIIVIRGKNAAGNIIPISVVADTNMAEDGSLRWDPKGPKTIYSDRQFWWSKHEVGFDERLDARGKDDVANPVGEWTRVDCICESDVITIQINGVTVNKCYDVFPSAGKILLENEGSEIFFRNFEIHALGDFD